MTDNITRQLNEAEATLTVSAALYAAAAGDVERLTELAAGMDREVAPVAFATMARWTAATVAKMAGGRSAALAILADSAEAELLEAAYALPETAVHAVLDEEQTDEGGGDRG
ncbi:MULTISPECIES: hypothetical protein [unclassified Rhodococcus (in: high G+C Gram-positive bacteria)]|uniref:hypothetical protein n=1 Tax=unclassified Rhodococcus (in: high G+C Gram-positive bacteria) TaxID=192944 RepID=UPI000928F7D7|nr:hypothetical protein [Rhodococcus sp. M8]OLL17471.1 hypothetical protein BKE56_019575 [Rhodococcus sp. M8]QPG45740.1 hypothetical protein ISO16_01170 [Rhodococcus sp. M8]